MNELPKDDDPHAHDGDVSDHWYVQQGARLQGPYTSGDIRRYLLLGRVRHNDRVSKDGDLWEPVTQVPELIPEELLDLESEQGWQDYLAKYRTLDERTAAASETQQQLQDPHFHAPQYDYREIDAEKRIHTDQETTGLIRREWSDSQGDLELPDQPAYQSISILPLSLLGLTLLALLVVIYLNTVSPIL